MAYSTVGTAYLKAYFNCKAEESLVLMRAGSLKVERKEKALDGVLRF